jgi:hypothetical protein
MGEYANLTPLEVRALRERSIDRMEHAAYAAWLSAFIAVVVLLIIGADTGDWRELAPFFGSAAATILLGYTVYQRRQWPAMILALNWVGGIVARWVETGRPPGIITTAVFGFFIIRGMLASFDYAELRKDHPDAVPEPAV